MKLVYLKSGVHVQLCSNFFFENMANLKIMWSIPLKLALLSFFNQLFPVGNLVHQISLVAFSMKNKIIDNKFLRFDCIGFSPIDVGLLFFILCIFTKCLELNFHVFFIPLPLLYWFTYYCSHDEGLHSNVEFNIERVWAFSQLFSIQL